MGDVGPIEQWYAPKLREFPTKEDADARCPNREMHDVVPELDGVSLPPRPKNYAQYFDWAEYVSRFFAQTRCEGCGRYLVWVPRVEGVEYDETNRKAETGCAVHQWMPGEPGEEKCAREGCEVTRPAEAP